jgi:hypothetical protein
MEITVRVNRYGGRASFSEVVLRFRTRLTTGVLAIAAYFHHVRFLGFFAVLAAILAIFLGWAIAGWMRALVFIVCHKTTLLSDWLIFPVIGLARVILERRPAVVKVRRCLVVP